MSTQPLKQQPRRYLTERQQLALALQESTIDFVPADIYDNDDDSSSDSESSNEDEDEDYLKNNNKLSIKKVRLPPMSRQQKELASLAPWAWDPLVSRHAPGPSALRDFSEVLTSVRKAGGMKIEEQLPTREQQSNKSNKQTKATMKSEKKAAATVATINDKENKVPKKDISANAKNSNNNNNKKNKKSSLGVSSSALITKTNEKKNNSNTKKQSTAVVVVAQQAAEKVLAALTTLTTTSKKGGCKNSKQARDEEKKAAAEATRAQEEKEEKVSPAAEVLLPTTTTKRTTKKRTPVMKKRGAGGGLKKHQEAFDEEDSIATTEEPKTAPQKRAQKSEQITPVAFELDAKVSAPKNSTHTKKNKKVVVDVKMSTAEKKLLLAKERGDKTQQLQGKKIQTPIGAAKKKLVLQTPLNERKSDTTIAKAVAAVEEANKLLSPTARRITSSAAKTLPSKKRPRTFSIDIANDVVLVGKPSPLQHLNQEQEQQQQQQQQQHQTMMTEEEKKERRDKFWIFLDTLQIKPPKEGNAGKKESLSASQKLFESFCFATGRKEKKSMMTTTVSVTKTKEREQDFICATTTTTTTTTLFNSETDYAVPVGKRVRLVPMSHALKVACTQLLMSATSSSPP